MTLQTVRIKNRPEHTCAHLTNNGSKERTDIHGLVMRLNVHTYTCANTHNLAHTHTTTSHTHTLRGMPKCVARTHTHAHIQTHTRTHKFRGMLKCVAQTHAHIRTHARTHTHTHLK